LQIIVCLRNGFDQITSGVEYALEVGFPDGDVLVVEVGVGQLWYDVLSDRFTRDQQLDLSLRGLRHMSENVLN